MESLCSPHRQQQITVVAVSLRVDAKREGCFGEVIRETRSK